MQGVTYEEHVSIKTGLPPGIPIYIGKHEPEQTHISALVYTPENTQCIRRSVRLISYRYDQNPVSAGSIYQGFWIMKKSVSIC
jgi:hypothetical protein